MAENTTPQTTEAMHPGTDAYNSRSRRVLVLTSYCSGVPGCTDDLPCIDCLRMCNTVTMSGPLTDNRGGYDFQRDQIP
jgi:hypothetical protein